MSQQDNFLGGFIAGAIFGSIVGGVTGALVANRLNRQEALPSKEGFPKKKLEGKPGRQVANVQNIESARRGLEDKIAQLNDAIDDVREKLGGVNGTPRPDVIEPPRLERRE